MAVGLGTLRSQITGVRRGTLHLVGDRSATHATHPCFSHCLQ
jgi:hypothetical protein